MRTITLTLIILAASTAGAETVYGHCEWSFSFPLKAFTQTGSLFFGTIPEGEISEIATATSTPEFLPAGPGNYDFDLPIPVYNDGTAAALDELIVIPHLRGAEDLIAIGGATFWMDIDYFGTGELGVEYGGLFDGSGVITLEIEVLAFRHGPLGNGANPGPFTGEWISDFIYPYHFTQMGPQLLGHLPMGEVSELAFASASEIVSEPGSAQRTLSIPRPVFADGSSATETEIIFTVHVRSLYRFPTHVDIHQAITWTGGDTIVMEWIGRRIEESDAEVEMRAWAFRHGSVATDSMSFSELKSLFR